MPAIDVRGMQESAAALEISAAMLFPGQDTSEKERRLRMLWEAGVVFKATLDAAIEKTRRIAPEDDETAGAIGAFAFAQLGRHVALHIGYEAFGAALLPGSGGASKWRETFQRRLNNGLTAGRLVVRLGDAGSIYAAARSDADEHARRGYLGPRSASGKHGAFTKFKPAVHLWAAFVELWARLGAVGEGREPGFGILPVDRFRGAQFSTRLPGGHQLPDGVAGFALLSDIYLDALADRRNSRGRREPLVALEGAWRIKT